MFVPTPVVMQDQTHVPFEGSRIEHGTTRLADWSGRVTYHPQHWDNLGSADVVCGIINKPGRLLHTRVCFPMCRIPRMLVVRRRAGRIGAVCPYSWRPGLGSDRSCLAGPWCKPASYHAQVKPRTLGPGAICTRSHTWIEAIKRSDLQTTSFQCEETAKYGVT